MIVGSASGRDASGGTMTPFLRRMIQAINLSEAEQGSLAALEARSERYSKGTELVRPGDRNIRPFVVRSGFVTPSRHNESGQRMIIDLLIPGDIGNARAIVLPEADMLYAALNDIDISHIPLEAYRELMIDHPRPSTALLWTGAISRSLLAERLYSLGRRNGYQRIGHFLLELLTRLDQVGLTEGPTFRAPLTLAILGDLLGLTPEHVSRILQRLRRDGLLATKRDHWQFTDRARMAQVCDFDAGYLHMSHREAGMPDATSSRQTSPGPA
jgi:CRP-like cAMP-binding protein